MSEFEDRLNSILSSPAEMEKIIGLARSLSDSHGADADADGHRASGNISSGGASSDDPFKDIDPKLFSVISRLLGEYSRQKGGKNALITAMKPYIKKDRWDTIDRAAEIAKLARVAKIALSEFGGEIGV